MKIFYCIALPILLIVLLEGCKVDIPTESSNVLEYDNILIYSDLSSRMNKSPDDSMIIEQVVDYFIKDCVKPGIKVNDRSSLSYSRINYFNSNCPAGKVDIDEIKNLEEKQLFVNNKSKQKNLNESIQDFKKAVQCSYGERDKGGLDILSLIYNEVNGGNHIKKPSLLLGESDTTQIKYDNQLFVFTDGYLEFSKEDGNAAFYFGQSEIDRVRKFCMINKVSPEDALKNNPSWKLRPLKCENNKLVNLYVLETSDRGLNAQKGTLKYTGDLSDNNILKTAWELWAAESGFKHFIWKPITKASTLPNDYVKSLIIHD
jgi:hypothetical protein